MEIATKLIFAIIFGGLEVFIRRKGYSDDPDFYYFSWYHLLMAGLFLSAAWPRWEIIFIMLFLEDISYYLFEWAPIHRDDWICKLAGSISFGKLTIPNAYIILILLQIIALKL